MAPRPPLERLEARPGPDEWDDDELVTLAEAVELFFPRGPLTIGGLRSAIGRHELPSVNICNRIYTTPGALRRLTRPVVDAPAATMAEMLMRRAKEVRQRGRR